MGEVCCLFCGMSVEDWMEDVALDQLHSCPRCGVLLGFASHPTLLNKQIQAKQGRLGRVLLDFPLELDLAEGAQQAYLICAWLPDQDLSTAQIATILGMVHNSVTRLCRELHHQTGLGRRGDSWLLPRSVLWDWIHVPRTLRFREGAGG